MNVMIAVQGNESDTFFRRVAEIVALRDANVALVHVIDLGPRSGLERGRAHVPGGRPLSPERGATLTAAEEEGAQAALQFAREALAAAGPTERRLREITLRGKPNEELIAFAESDQADLIVVGGRAGKPGPHSIGKTARFLIDHAPRAALLVRG